ncbi:MAG: DUF6265 family protein [Bryobacteraceae bacterium]
MKLAMIFLLAAAAFAQDVAALSFLTGCWSMSQGPMVIEEEWSRPAADGMLGFSRTLKGGKTVFSEFMRVEKKGATLVYLPRIGTKEAAVAFTMTKMSAEEVIFENPRNDFPQRILYRKVEGGLHARIDGKQKGKERAEDFPYKRVACEPK